MIGLGSPADTMRESDVIVLMVFPLLALRLVIDHNTKQGTEFPCFCVTAAPGSVGLPDQSSASQSLRPERIVGNSERCKSRCLGGFLGHRRGAGGCPCIACRVPSLAKAAFFVFLVPQFGFWPLRPRRAERPHSFRIFPKPGLWRGPQRCGCASLTSRLH